MDTDVQARFDEIVRAAEYLTLATADADGRPWSCPVWFATQDRRTFYWVSDPTATHSRNVAARPEIAFSVFDSRQTPGTGVAAYVSALAEPVPEGDIDAAIAVYDTASRERVGTSWARSEVDGSGRFRIYRAVADARFVLSNRDQRIAVPT